MRVAFHGLELSVSSVLKDCPPKSDVNVTEVVAGGEFHMLMMFRGGAF